MGSEGRRVREKRGSGHGVQEEGTRVGGGHGSGNRQSQYGRQGEATRWRCGSWWPPLVPREQADHDEQALTASWTQVPRAEGRAPGIGRLRRWCGRGGWGVGYVPCQAELELVQEGTMDRTPQPIVADFVEPLGQHMLQKATDELMGGQGHGLPTLVLGVLVAEAHLPISDGEEAVVGQRDPVDSPGLGPSGLAPCLAR